MKNRIKYIVSFVATLMAQPVYAEDLMSLYGKALKADPSLKSAQYQLAMGEAQQGQAGGALLPQINANLNMSLNERTPVNGNSDAYEGERYNVSLTQSVIDLPKYWDWQRSKEVVKQFESEQKEAEQILMLDLVERYFSALEAEDEHFLIQQEKQATQKQLQQLNQQFKKQVIKITDVLEVEAKLNSLEADEIEAETISIIAKEALTELTGEKVDNLDALKTDIDFLPIEGELSQWIEISQQSNPTLKAKLRSISAASKSVAQQKSRHLPIVDLQLTYYFSNTGFESSQVPESETQVAALNISVPLFSGGVTTRRADEASQRLEIAKQENIATQREIVKLVRDSFLTTNASIRRIKAAQKALKSSSKSKDAMEQGFKYGEQTI